MSEGELKKRIADKMHEEYNGMDSEEVEDMVISITDIFNILDEMQAELPFKELPDFDRFVDIRFIPQETREIFRWFKKWWFGEAKPKNLAVANGEQK